MASNECPPSSKKLSCTPTRSRPRTSDHSRDSSCSTAVRGATKASSSSGRVPPGTGRAFRSTLPWGVSGSPSSNTNDDGTMYSGSLSPKNWRSSGTSLRANSARSGLLASCDHGRWLVPRCGNTTGGSAPPRPRRNSTS